MHSHDLELSNAHLEANKQSNASLWIQSIILFTKTHKKWQNQNLKPKYSKIIE